MREAGEIVYAPNDKATLEADSSECHRPKGGSLKTILENTEELDEFAARFARMQAAVWKVNDENGWWDKRRVMKSLLNEGGHHYEPHLAIELLGLASTEISEAIEAARKHHRDDWGDATTKDTMVRECAGTVLRLMDLCEYFGLPLGEAIIAEVRANQGRGHKHGGKAA